MSMKYLFAFADASAQSWVTGLGVAIKDQQGRFIAWRSCAEPPMTNMEAEYCAVIFALEQLSVYQPAELEVFSDCKTVVEQLSGTITVRNDRLRPLYERAKHLALAFAKVRFRYVPRAHNRLADALASEACQRA